MDENPDPNALAKMLRRDPLVAAMFLAAGALIVLLFAATAMARRGNMWFLEDVLRLTMAFAIVGAGAGLVRNLRGGPASRQRRA